MSSADEANQSNTVSNAEASAEDNSKAQFIPTDQPGDIQTFFREASYSAVTGAVWTKEHTQHVPMRVRGFDPDKNLFKIQVPGGLGLTEEEFKRIQDIEIYFNMLLANASIFFKGHVVSYEGNEFIFKTPTKVFKVQRRKDVRLNIPHYMPINVTIESSGFPNGQVVKPLTDLSAGGLSILLSGSESMFFHKGLKLRGIVFTLYGRNFYIAGEVMYVKTLSDRVGKSRRKVGIQFTKLREDDREFIASFINDQARNLFSSVF